MATIMVAFLITISAHILVAAMRSAWKLPGLSTGITASGTVAIVFGYKERWPSGWSYDDNVYVDYVGGAYYMYNPRHPGIHITLNLF